MRHMSCPVLEQEALRTYRALGQKMLVVRLSFAMVLSVWLQRTSLCQFGGQINVTGRPRSWGMPVLDTRFSFRSRFITDFWTFGLLDASQGSVIEADRVDPVKSVGNPRAVDSTVGDQTVPVLACERS